MPVGAVPTISHLTIVTSMSRDEARLLAEHLLHQLLVRYVVMGCRGWSPQPVPEWDARLEGATSDRRTSSLEGVSIASAARHSGTVTRQSWGTMRVRGTLPVARRVTCSSRASSALSGVRFPSAPQSSHSAQFSRRAITVNPKRGQQRDRRRQSNAQCSAYTEPH